jgi:hypothetical protein
MGFRRHATGAKAEAALAWIVTGSCSKAANMVGVPVPTFRYWMSSQWWDSAVEYARRTKQTELEGSLTGIIHKALENVNLRLSEGDEVISATGNKMHKAVGAKDCALIAKMFMQNKELANRVQLPADSKGVLGRLDDLKKAFEDEEEVTVN